MRYLQHILGLTISAMVITGCQSEDLADTWTEQLSIGEMMPVKLTAQVSADAFSAVTRGAVVGTENLSDPKMKLLCFSADGLFLGAYDATLTPTPGTTSGDGLNISPIKGTVEAEVPDQTTSIHFIMNPPANFLKGSSYVGWLENRLMRDVATTVGVSDVISYWGYHKADDASAMKSYLQPEGEGATSNTIRLIRDRVMISMDPTIPTAENSADQIESVKWTIYNGYSRGYIAPFKEGDANPFIDTDKGTGQADLSDTPLTMYEGANRYTDTPTLQESTVPQYLFEDAFEEDDNQKVSIILELTYVTGPIRYHRVALQKPGSKENEVLLRNHDYLLSIGSFPCKSGSATLEEALSAPLSNNSAVSVSPVVPDVSDGTYTLTMGDLGENTTKIFSENDTNAKTVNFYLRDNYGTQITDLSKFKIEVVDEGSNGAVASASFDTEYTGGTRITYTLKPLTDMISHSTIKVTHIDSGLSRNVEVYTINQFNISNTKLESVGQKNISVQVSHTDPYYYDIYGNEYLLERDNGGYFYYNINNRKIYVTPSYTKTTTSTEIRTHNVYKLTFDLPTNIYPEGLYPMRVKFATTTLTAYSDDETVDNVEHGSFGVESGDTSMLVAGESNTSTDWNYNASNWNAWCVYTITKKPDSPTITFYLYDVTGSRTPAPTSVGLFLQIEYFGKPYSVHVGSVSQLE